MATIYDYTCAQCGKEMRFSTGVIMRQPRKCEDVVCEMREGKHGEELKRLCDERQLVAVEADWKLYECPCCGFWGSYTDLTLYEPDDLENALSKAEASTDPWGWDRPPALPTLGIGWHVVKDYRPECPRCGGEMAAREGIGHGVERERLPCPECGAMNTPVDVGSLD